MHLKIFVVLLVVSYAASIEADLRRLQKIDRQIAAAVERKLFEERGASQTPMERRHYGEGSTDLLQMDLPAKAYRDLLFVRTNIYRERRLARYSSDVLLVYTQREVELYDLSGELLASLQLGTHR